MTILADTIDPSCLDLTEDYILNVFDESDDSIVGTQTVLAGILSYSVDVGVFTGDYYIIGHPVNILSSGSILAGHGTVT